MRLKVVEQGLLGGVQEFLHTAFPIQTLVFAYSSDTDDSPLNIIEQEEIYTIDAGDKFSNHKTRDWSHWERQVPSSERENSWRKSKKSDVDRFLAGPPATSVEQAAWVHSHHQRENAICGKLGTVQSIPSDQTESTVDEEGALKNPNETYERVKISSRTAVETPNGTVQTRDPAEPSPHDPRLGQSDSEGTECSCCSVCCSWTSGTEWEPHRSELDHQESSNEGGSQISHSPRSKEEMENELQISHDEDGRAIPSGWDGRESSHKPVTLTSTPIGKPVAFNLLLEGILKELAVDGSPADPNRPEGPIEKCLIYVEAEPRGASGTTPIKISKDGPECCGTFVPQSVGVHELTVEGSEVNGELTVDIRPKRVLVFDASKVSLVVPEDQVGFQKGKPFTFEVDAKEAGPGTLEIIVTSEQGSVPVGMRPSDNGDGGHFLISFWPEDRTLDHMIIITYNGKLIPGMPVRIKASQDCHWPIKTNLNSTHSNAEDDVTHSSQGSATFEDQIFTRPDESLEAGETFQIRPVTNEDLESKGFTDSVMAETTLQISQRGKGSQGDPGRASRKAAGSETEFAKCKPGTRRRKEIGEYDICISQDSKFHEDSKPSGSKFALTRHEKDFRPERGFGEMERSQTSLEVAGNLNVTLEPASKHNFLRTCHGELVLFQDPNVMNERLEMRVEVSWPRPMGLVPQVKAYLLPAQKYKGKSQEARVVSLKNEERNAGTTKSPKDDKEEDTLRFLTFIPLAPNESEAGGLAWIFILEIFPYANIMGPPLCQTTPLLVFNKEDSIFASQNDDILVLGDGLTRAVVHESAAFFIYLLQTGANPGPKDAHASEASPVAVMLKDPQNRAVPVQLLPERQIGPWQKPKSNSDPTTNSSYRLVLKASYLPTTLGDHILHVQWQGRELAGFPKKVEVINQHDQTDETGTKPKIPAHQDEVLLFGPGPKSNGIACMVPRQVPRNKFSIVEVHSHNPAVSPKSLTASLVPTSCDGSNTNGPSSSGPILSHLGGSQCEVQHRGHGKFHIILQPRSIGEHMLHVYYRHERVPGSPFVLEVVEPPSVPDVALGHRHVRVFGPGLEHGLLYTFHSEFICDARDAGPGQLTVKVRGPKGAFQTEMLSSSAPGHDNRIILCRYNPTEPGDYLLEIKWSGHHIPGSPFFVMIFDTLKELRRFLDSIQDFSSERRSNLRFFPTNHPMSSLQSGWENVSTSSFEVRKSFNSNVGYLTLYNRSVPSPTRTSDRFMIV